MALVEALGLKGGEVVAFVGAGGKTTAIYRLADELARAGKRVLITTTTHIFPPESPRIPVLTGVMEELIRRADEAFAGHPVAVAARGLGPDGKLLGIDPAWVGELAERTLATNVLVEADGSAKRPFKAPADHEPVIPTSANLVVVVAGLSALGKPISSGMVHRPERVTKLAGVGGDDLLTPDIVATVLLHPEGGLKGIAPDSRVAFLLNQADDEGGVRDGREVGRRLLGGGARLVLIAALRDPNPVREVALADGGAETGATVAAVVLAAGEARRMGGRKLGLQVGGKSLLRRVLESALHSSADEVLVVLGHDADTLAGELPSDPRLRSVFNPEYSAGQSTSMKVGVAALGEQVDAVVFLLADQPAVEPRAVDAVVRAFRERRPRLAVAQYRGVPGHPVLFARALFPELLRVTGDRGGREVLARYRQEARVVEMDTEPPADVDTAEDLARLSVDYSEG